MERSSITGFSLPPQKEKKKESKFLCTMFLWISHLYWAFFEASFFFFFLFAFIFIKFNIVKEKYSKKC